MSVSSQQVTEVLQQIMSNPESVRQLREKLGINASQEKDKNQVLLNDHTFRRIDKFTGPEGTWQEWSFNVIMTIAQVDPELGDRLEEIKTNSVKPLTNDLFGEPDDFPKMTIGMLETYGPSLYGVLCSLTGGEANSVVRSISANMGSDGSIDNVKCGFSLSCSGAADLILLQCNAVKKTQQHTKNDMFSPNTCRCGLAVDFSFHCILCGTTIM